MRAGLELERWVTMFIYLCGWPWPTSSHRGQTVNFGFRSKFPQVMTEARVINLGTLPHYYEDWSTFTADLDLLSKVTAWGQIVCFSFSNSQLPVNLGRTPPWGLNYVQNWGELSQCQDIWIQGLWILPFGGYMSLNWVSVDELVWDVGLIKTQHLF